MEYILSMTFLTTTGKKSALTINGVKPDLTDEQVKNLMNLIIEKDVFLTNKGKFVKIDSAQLTQREIKKYNVAA